MTEATIVWPDEVESVLLRGDTEWRDVERIEQGYWRLEDGSSSPRGRRGWVIDLVDGGRVCCDVKLIEGVK